jgi:hypothetical protein
MSRIARILASGTTMLLALVMLTGNATGRYFDEIADAQKEVQKLYDLIDSGKGKVDSAKAAAIAKQIKNKFDDLNLSMSIYKPTKNKGIGYNPAKKGPGDGIEKRLTDLATKKELTKEQLTKEKDLLIRTAIYNLALHEIAHAYVPAKPKGGKGPKDWNKYNKDMKDGSQDLIKAANATDPKAVKKAAGKINSACNDCHTDFR